MRPHRTRLRVADLEAALVVAGVTDAWAQVILDENEAARIAGLRASLSILAVAGLVALYFTRMIPNEPVGDSSGREPNPQAAVE